MKYRIVQLNNGRFMIQKKNGLFDDWHDIYSYEHFKDAEEEVIRILDANKERKEDKIKRGINKVIKVYKV